MNHNIVVCNKAHKYDACSSCDHADSHERLDMKPFRATQASYCTSWGECWINDKEIAVRCTKVKEVFNERKIN